MTTYTSGGISYTIDSEEPVALKIALMGPSGTGKTYGALTLAFGMAKEIEKQTGVKQVVGMIDTENGSGKLYKRKFPYYKHIGMVPPYTVDAYVEVMKVAEEQGVTILIIDSTTHAWNQILAEKDSKDKGGGNSYINWGPFKKKYQLLKDEILQSPLIVISTMRAKTDHVQNKDSNGRTTIEKKGMGAIQEPGMEYEFTLVLETRHPDCYSTAVKDRTDLWSDGRECRLTEREGKELAEWLLCTDPAPVDPTPPSKIGSLAVNALKVLVTTEGFPYKIEDKDGVRAYVANLVGRNVPYHKFSEITQDDIGFATIEFSNRVEGIAMVKGALGVENMPNTTEDALAAVNDFTNNDYDDVYFVTSADWTSLLDNFEDFVKRTPGDKELDAV